MITMRRIVRAVPLITLVPMLAVTARAAPPPEPQLLRVEVAPMGILLRVESTVPIQGRLTDSAGHPVADANYNITFRVRDNAATVLCTVGPTAVHTENGLFNASLTGCPADIFDGKFLSLGVQVGGDAEMTPGLPIRPVPYAMSLRPGATINNQDAGRGLTVVSGQSGSAGTALWAENTNSASGIGLWAKAAGEDATVISTNVSTGALFKGFGSGGGEDEFRVQNDGTIETKADSYVFVPGAGLTMTLGLPNDEVYVDSSGTANVIVDGAGFKSLVLPFTVPAMLYGQPVEIKDVQVFYGTANSASYIDTTEVKRQKLDNSTYSLVYSDVDRASTTYTSYLLSTVSHDILSQDEGIMCIAFQMYFASDSHVIVIGGVRIHLNHHDLY